MRSNAYIVPASRRDMITLIWMLPTIILLGWFATKMTYWQNMSAFSVLADLAPKIESEILPAESVVYMDSVAVTRYDTLRVNISATCYNPVPAQTDGSPDRTAWGDNIDLAHPEKHRWIAVSPDLERIGFNHNDTVWVTGTWVYDGWWIIKDRMHHMQRAKIDFLVNANMYMNYWKAPRHPEVFITKVNKVHSFDIVQRSGCGL